MILQRLPQLLDRRVDALLEVDKGIGGPQFLPEFFPRYKFPRPVEQDGKDLERLFLELDLATVLAQLTGGQVDFEGTETGTSSLCGGYLHGQ